MQDKSFLQATQDVQNRIVGNLQESILHMLLHGATATNATGDIQDEKMRSIVTNELITGQILAFLTLMRDLHVLDGAHYDEFSAYLLRSLLSQHGEIIPWHNLK